MPKERTKVGKFLQTLKGVAPDILKLAGTITGVTVLSNLGDAIKKTDTLTPEAKEIALDLIKLDYADLADARDLQKVALQQDDLFAKRFVYYLTIGVFSFSVLIVLLLFIVEIPEKNRDVVNFILGVVVGTGLTGIFQYFFGSSAGSKDKSIELKNITR
tara:strand:+ start:115 stop:591 length:477 start_codon:yes stop_codon:yes gene_type:complete